MLCRVLAAKPKVVADKPPAAPPPSAAAARKAFAKAAGNTRSAVKVRHRDAVKLAEPNARITPPSMHRVYFPQKRNDVDGDDGEVGTGVCTCRLAVAHVLVLSVLQKGRT